jgi:hypothetical protein
MLPCVLDTSFVLRCGSAAVLRCHCSVIDLVSRSQKRDLLAGKMFCHNALPLMRTADSP